MAPSLTELLEASGDNRLVLSATGLNMEVMAVPGLYRTVLNDTVFWYDETSFMQFPHEYADAQLTAHTHLQEQARNLLASTHKTERLHMQLLTGLKSPPKHWESAAMTTVRLTVPLIFLIFGRTLSPKSWLEKAAQRRGEYASAYESA
ncbi:hypothetical protein HYV82_00290 [Candidatus Woesearchaeota archaeon]|nr:hypothetical protein [Candidatus Woesearchaeota archaeon]